VLLNESGEDFIARHVFDLVGRSTFPMGGLTAAPESAAFLFNDLLSSDDEGDQVVTWILTADAMTHTELGQFGIRPEMADARGASADNVIMTDYEQSWYRLPELGVAAMPMRVLERYAAAKGWAWDTQEVSQGMAATAADIAALAGAHTALVLGHPDEDHRRPLSIAFGRITQTDGAVTLLGAVEGGFVGAPVFAAIPRPDAADPDELKIICVGVLLPREGDGHPVATFDRIRTAVRHVWTNQFS
jgi:hypothetical protein